MSEMIYTDHVMGINKLIPHTHAEYKGIVLEEDSYVDGGDVAHGDRVPLDKMRWHKHTGGGGVKVYIPTYVGNWVQHGLVDHTSLFDKDSGVGGTCGHVTCPSDTSLAAAWQATSGITKGTTYQQLVCFYQMFWVRTPTVAFWLIQRGFLVFDTSSLSGETVIQAILRVRGVAYTENTNGNPSLVIQNGQPDYPTIPLQYTDYNKALYSDDGGSVSFENFNSDGNWTEITLTDPTWINTEGFTKLCLRTSSDIAGTDYGITEGVNWDDRFSLIYSPPQLMIFID